MKRRAYAQLELEVLAPAQLILSLAVAGRPSSETLSVNQFGSLVYNRQLHDQHGTRLHVVQAEPGSIRIDYTVEVDGALPLALNDDVDEIRYLRPSRYCESDTLGPIARSEFAGLTSRDLLASVSSWVGQQLYYVPGSSGPTDGAVQTLLARQG